MPHRSSAPGVHAAQTLLKNYEFTVIPREKLAGGVSCIPNLQASFQHLSVLIDMTTNVHLVCELRPQVCYWQERLACGNAPPGQVVLFLRRMIEEMTKIPDNLPMEERPRLVFDAPPGVTLRGNQDTYLSQASVVAVRALLQYYYVKPLRRKFYTEYAMHMDMAKIIEASLGLRKAIQILPQVRECESKIMQNQLELRDVQSYFRSFGVGLEYLSSYRERGEETKLLI